MTLPLPELYEVVKERHNKAFNELTKRLSLKPFNKVSDKKHWENLTSEQRREALLR